MSGDTVRENVEVAYEGELGEDKECSLTVAEMEVEGREGLCGFLWRFHPRCATIPRPSRSG